MLQFVKVSRPSEKMRVWMNATVSSIRFPTGRASYFFLKKEDGKSSQVKEVTL
jgi:hypothetical protein